MDFIDLGMPDGLIPLTLRPQIMDFPDLGPRIVGSLDLEV